MTDDLSIIKKKGVKKLLQELGLNTASNVPAEVESLVKNILRAAADRTKKNHRKTVMPHDVA